MDTHDFIPYHTFIPTQVSAPRMSQQQATSTMVHCKVRIRIFHSKPLKKVFFPQVTCDSSSHTSLLL